MIPTASRAARMSGIALCIKSPVRENLATLKAVRGKKYARRWVNYFATPLPPGADRLPDEDDLTEMMAVVIGHEENRAHVRLLRLASRHRCIKILRLACQRFELLALAPE